MNNNNPDNIEKSFVINLKKRKDRLENFLKNKDSLTGLDIFEAIDGQLLSYDDNKNLMYLGNKILENHLIKKINHLKVGEIGAFLSHYFIWKKIIKLNKACLIFEDDAKPCKDFTNKLNTILQKGTPNDYNILWVGIRQHNIQDRIYNKEILPNKNKLENQYFYHYINSKYNPFYPYCYIISPNTCKFLCNLFENTDKRFPAVDHFICSNLTNNYICINNDSPIFLCHAPQGDSDIQTYNDKLALKNKKYL